MNLIFVRHAAAIERSAEISEEQRYLTSQGRVFFRKTAQTMLKNGIEPSLIISSPLIRAVQTADILAETLTYIGQLVIVDALSPGFALPSLRELCDTFHSANELVLVGHEPDLSSMVGSLLNLPSGFDFKKGAAVKVKIDPARPKKPAVFKWLASGRKLMAKRKEAFSL
jgi:phosphohistidine phosphatase